MDALLPAGERVPIRRFVLLRAGVGGETVRERFQGGLAGIRSVILTAGARAGYPDSRGLRSAEVRAGWRFGRAWESAFPAQGRGISSFAGHSGRHDPASRDLAPMRRARTDAAPRVPGPGADASRPDRHNAPSAGPGADASRPDRHSAASAGTWRRCVAPGPTQRPECRDLAPMRRARTDTVPRVPDLAPMCRARTDAALRVPDLAPTCRARTDASRRRVHTAHLRERFAHTATGSPDSSWRPALRGRSVTACGRHLRRLSVEPWISGRSTGR